MEEKKPTDPLELIDNTPRSNPRGKGPKSKGNRKPELTIQDRYADEFIEATTKPFWMPDLNKYMFGPQKLGSGYCDRKAILGGTMDKELLSPGTTTICMSRVFSAGGGTQTLGAEQPAKNRPVTDFVSKGITLYHEHFHLVIGNAEPVGNICKLYITVKCAAMT